MKDARRFFGKDTKLVSHSAECNIEVYGEIAIEAGAWHRKTIAPGSLGNFTFEGTGLHPCV
jgi:hypothetical protein